jgi:hypothetical protein
MIVQESRRAQSGTVAAFVSRQAMEVGVACLRKPFPADLLVETLVKAIGHVHAWDE